MISNVNYIFPELFLLWLSLLKVKMDLRDNPYKNELMFAGFNQDQGMTYVAEIHDYIIL